MTVENLTFYGQRIANLTGEGFDEYELLLRSHDNRFPGKEYSQYMENAEKHAEYMEFLMTIIPKILSKNESTIFSLNIDHQDLEYDDTFTFLESIDEASRSRLKIELTEVAPLHRSLDAYFNGINEKSIARIHDLGYKIIYDDIAVGMNSIGNLLAIKKYVSRIKWSYLHFSRHFEVEQLREIILLLSNISQAYEMELVIEGVENQGMVNWLRNNSLNFHQGFYYSKPESLTTIDY
jgi:EAL domain-containing protein (putative c-di-GMP-specific phosphodiesterase class I)